MRRKRRLSFGGDTSGALIRRATVEQLEIRLNLSTNVLSYHYDNTGSGVNSSEVQLTPQNVTTGSFGKLFTVPLDGNVYGQPLVDTGVTIADGVNTSPMAAGVHNVVFVATENDTLYAIDSSTTGGAILWKRSFLNTVNSGGDQNNTLGATAITTVTSDDVGAADISPTIGITATPVIDPSTNLLYVVTKTKETIGGKIYMVQRLHAINIADGTDAATPYLIGQTTGPNTNTTPIYVYGTGGGHTTDPYNGTGKQVVQFNAFHEALRTALSLVNGTLYISWASHGDNGPYHGWVCTWDVSKVTTSGFKLTGVLNTSPNENESGIWSGGGEIVFEPDNSAFYFMTGNGFGGAPTLGSNGLPTNANYNEAVVKAVVDHTSTPTSQNPNGWGLKIVDFFSPYNTAAMDSADSDFGSSEPLLLPPSAGIPGHPNLLVAGGKDGRLYLLDRDNLGEYHSNGDHALNSVLNSSGIMTPPVLTAGLLSAPTFYNGHIYLTSGYNGHAEQLAINPNGTLTKTSQTAISSMGYLPGPTTVSSNGTTDGIAWVMDRNLNAIHAYDASTFNTELWNSLQAPGGADSVGAVVKFASPTVANGEVYIGTLDSLVVYGLTAPADQAPVAPVLTSSPLSGTSINLTWTDASVAPNTASGYLIEESSDHTPSDNPDDSTFSQLTTAPAGAQSVSIGALSPNTTYYFRIRGYNVTGDSDYSNVASATTSDQSAAIDFSSGFVGAGAQLDLNGTAAISGSNLLLTNGGAMQAGSAFTNVPIDVTQFDTQFTFQLSAGTSTADGFTFTFQNVGPHALGGNGGQLGYGPGTGVAAIGTSVTIKFDLFSNAGEGADSTGLYINGAMPTIAGSMDLTPSGVNLHSGDIFNVELSYDGTTLSEIITDTKTSASVTETYTINIPGTVGGPMAYVGFTAGTGGKTATQQILSWIYTLSATVSPDAPTGLGATPASATSIALNWTANATNQTGYHLDRATDPDFTQNFITENLPAFPNSYTDTAPGLAPDGTYYYRLRATNGAGDSDNTNVAIVSIPLAPPKPTDQEIDDVTATSIDITWQDNAGHLADGYRILRATNNGSFTTVVTLPPTSRPAPSAYSWTDTNLTPGAFYEYHIQAFNVSGNNDFAGVNATTLPSAPASVTATPGNGFVDLAWTAPAGAVSYNVYRSTSAGGEGSTPFATGITTTSFHDPSVVNGTKYYYTVTAVNANAAAGYMPPLPSEGSASKEVSATPNTVVVSGSPLPSSIDIGAPGKKGSSSYSNGTYTVSGGGSDIYNSSDQFHYDYQNASGDMTIVARVASITSGYYWAKAGVMIRNTTAANSMFADVVVTADRGVAFQWRPTAGGPSSTVTISGKKAPLWVKLVRSGNVFSAYYSSDGIAWTQIGASKTIVMAKAVTTGLAVCSVQNSQLATATFTNVAVM